MKQHIKYLFGLFILSGLIFNSCSKEEESNHIGLETEVFIRSAKLSDQKPSALGAINKNSKLASKAPVANSSEIEVQELVIPFSDELSIVARLEPVNQENGRSMLLADSNPNGVEITQGLENGTLYRVLVYDDNGEYVAHKDFKVGEEKQEDSFKLTSGNTYTFVSYSIGSETELPNLKNGERNVSLNEASLHEIGSARLMYQKQNVQIVGGRDNYVDILMKHQFSQITTIIRHKYEAGRIDAVSNARFTPVRENASLAFHNNSLSYSSSTKEAAVVFGDITGNTHEVISQPVSLISEETESAEFKIESLTINGLSNPLVYDNLKITPGVRYNLILEIDARCIKDTDKRALNLTEASGVETFTLPAADYGFVFDIFELDNSFDMKINGVHILASERMLQLCSGLSPTWTGATWKSHDVPFKDINFENPKNNNDRNLRNIRFQDGTIYGANDQAEIWDIKGTPENPAIRVVIGKDGSINLYGSKVSNGPLFPLEIYNFTSEYEFNSDESCGLTSLSRKKERIKYKLNTVTWHNDRDNIVEISQAKINVTRLKGSGYGQQKVSCADM